MRWGRLLIGTLVGTSGCGWGQSPVVIWGADVSKLPERGAVRIEAGNFQMGSPESEEGRFGSENLHDVKFTRPFWIGTTEVTQAQYQAVMGRNPSWFHACGPHCPVEKVSWLDAINFCNRVSEMEGLKPVYSQEGRRLLWDRSANGYRLPTEAEWEYAARAGTRTRFAGSNQVDEVAWYNKNAKGSTHPVGQKQPNPWGLYDMSGNVREWVWNWAYYPYNEDDNLDPVGPPTGNDRINRGGSWSADERRVRTAYRRWGPPDERVSSIGFRLARNVD